MQLGPLSQAATPTPLHKMQDNAAMGTTTPSRFMSSVVQNGTSHLALPPYMGSQAVFPPQLLMSSGFKEDPTS
jgi:hypothetical protein